MEKPLTIKRAEFTQKLAQVINESKLPAFIIADTLKQVTAQMQELANAQYQKDLKAYEESQKEEGDEANE